MHFDSVMSPCKLSGWQCDQTLMCVHLYQQVLSPVISLPSDVIVPSISSVMQFRKQILEVALLLSVSLWLFRIGLQSIIVLFVV